MNDTECVKVVLIGESGVGKTSIINRFTTDVYDPDVESSLSAQFSSKKVDFPEYGKSLKFDVWDTAGQEKFRSLAKIFYKDAKIIIFVYEIINNKSLNEIKNYWLDEIRSNAASDIILGLVANKDDLYGDEENKSTEVPTQDGIDFSKEINAIFQRTSAKSNTGINTLFENLGKKYINPNYDYTKGDDEQKKQYEEKKKLEASNKKSKGLYKNNDRLKLDKKKNKDKKRGGCCNKN